MGEKLTKADVLWAIGAAVAPFTGYIHDRVCQHHRDRVSSGDVPLWEFESPTVAMLLRRLKELEAEGVLTRSAVPRGNYGYEWSLRPAALQEPSP